MLPGQQLINGVSSFLFGSNMSPDYGPHTSRNTPQIQQQIKQAGITLLRCAIDANSPDSYIEQTVQACQNMNCAMLVILSYRSGYAWNQHLVTVLGNRCFLYEFSNEPDIASPGIKWQDYRDAWNQQIPQLRKINPQAAFLGPALGVYANVQSYLVPWLQATVQAGTIPDGVSFHNYPCTGTTDAATAATKSDRLGVSATKLDAVVKGIVGHSLPLCLTEWNIDAGNPPASYAKDPNFVPKWTREAIDGMVSAGVALACQWDAGAGAGGGVDDLVSVSNYQPNPNGQLGAMAERIQHYLGGGTPIPTPTPTPVPSIGAQMAKAGPFHVTPAGVTVPHGLGVMPDLVLPSIQSDPAASHTCSVDYTTMTDTQVTIKGDGEMTVYLLSVKL